MLDRRSEDILNLIKEHSGVSSRAVHEGIASSMSYATVKRILSDLIESSLLVKTGQGKSTRYELSPTYELLRPIDLDEYFEKEIDEREIREQYNFRLIPDILPQAQLFTNSELNHLNALQARFANNVSQLSGSEYLREFERLAIDLSWKSSQIEGNTYSLLETEMLLKEKHTASGKSREEATMLLNHKEALDFIMANPGYFLPLSVSKIENLHSILIKELGVDRNIRRRRVGISGTNYRPLDNEFQIMEALSALCELFNGNENVFERALLLLLLISYIQPFSDGNKRTARILANAILVDHGYCPISFRTVDSVDYKKALLVFYEQNNISCFKQIFLEQFEFAVNTYF